MLINDVLKTRFFTLLAGASQEVTTDEMQSAYEDFIKQVDTLKQSENDYDSIIRIFNFIRIELVFLDSLFSYGKQCA